MIELRELLERLANADVPRDADEVFDAADARASTLRRRRRIRSTLIAVTLVVALGVTSIVVIEGDRPTTRVTTTPSTSAPARLAGATAAHLASGTWSLIPNAPIPARDSASVVWTGRELLVWGGQSGSQGQQLHADGAAYNPSTRAWRMLPASPLSARTGQAAVWTGEELFVWGGDDNVGSGQRHVAADGATYNPSTNTWRTLPTAPLSARSGAIAVWTGSRVVLLGGAPATINETISLDADGAAYEPPQKRWQHIEAPVAPNNHPLNWRIVVPTDPRRLLAWSVWANLDRDPIEFGGGADIFAYDASTNRWTNVANAPDAIADPVEALWTGRYALVRGVPINCGACNRPYIPAITSRYDPAHNEWTKVAADPIDGSSSAWTGGALWSLNTGSSGGGPLGSYEPGDTSVYDPTTNTWTRLQRAPYRCITNSAPNGPIWNGEQVLIYCPAGAPAPAAPASGLAYTPTRSR